MPIKPVDDYQNHTDEMLLRLVMRKDVRAYEALYDRHAQLVYSLVVRIVRDLPVAEELLQEIFWQVWQKAEQYEGSGSAMAWLYRIARNRALDQLRRQRARPQAMHSELEVLEHSPKFVGRSAESDVEQSWRRQHVLQGLDNIPDDQRLCLELAYFEGLSQREISERINIPLGTIKTRMRSGMEKLERFLRGVGYVEREERE